MATRIKNTTREYLGSVELPVYSDTYTVISHEYIIENTLEQLGLAGFGVSDASYRCTADGNIAQGLYYLTYKSDPDIGMMFAWSNSYNKQMRFKCAMGGHVFVCLNGMLTGDMGSWNRKHTGTADQEAKDAIIDQVGNAQIYYNQLVSDKDKMKAVLLNKKEQASLLGILFAQYSVITTEQASIIKQQMDRPEFDYNADKNSLWAFYNHATLALKKSHPRTWMEDQRTLHAFISLEFDLYNFDITPGLPTAVVEEDVTEGETIDPAQTNILDQIEEIESDKLELPQAPSSQVDVHEEGLNEPFDHTTEIDVNREEKLLLIDKQEGDVYVGLSPDVVEPKIILTNSIPDIAEYAIKSELNKEVKSEIIKENFEFTDDDDDIPLNFDL